MEKERGDRVGDHRVQTSSAPTLPSHPGLREGRENNGLDARLPGAKGIPGGRGVPPPPYPPLPMSSGNAGVGGVKARAHPPSITSGRPLTGTA